MVHDIIVTIFTAILASTITPSSGRSLTNPVTVTAEGGGNKNVTILEVRKLGSVLLQRNTKTPS